MKRVTDVQRLRVVEVDETAAPDERLHAEVLVVGGGLGGVAAALAATAAGRTVCLTEETSWLGGQATSQGVSAFDENNYIESTGGTRTYQQFRTGIREWYRRNARLTPAAAADKSFNPGRGWVSRVCFEPKAALAVIDEMLSSARDSGHLRVLKRSKPYAIARDGPRLKYVDLVSLDDNKRFRVSADFFIDASELGDLLALGAAPFITGAESKALTGEPHAADIADPEDVQSFTYPFVVEDTRRAASGPASSPASAATAPAEYVGSGLLDRKPGDYDRNRAEQPYSLTLHYATRGDIRYGMFEKRPKTYGAFWTYRRLIDAGLFDDPRYRHDVSMINWPGNDYRGGNILVDSPDEQIVQLRAAKALSLGLAYWLQHEVERDDGGRGYPEFKLRLDVLGSTDGLSKFPYIRESRRILAVKTIVEQELTAAHQSGPRAAHFPDSVGIGYYAIDIHESKRGRKQVIDPTKPFQIPLGALIPRDVPNLLAACKNIGTTHITNGCYRLHPVEWAIGEAAGAAAAAALEWNRLPVEIRDDRDMLLKLQWRLVARGVPLMWYDDVRPGDPRFERAHMLPFENPETLRRLQTDLHAPK